MVRVGHPGAEAASPMYSTHWSGSERGKTVSDSQAAFAEIGPAPDVVSQSMVERRTSTPEHSSLRIGASNVSGAVKYSV
jgi:hypothetical protein